MPPIITSPRVIGLSQSHSQTHQAVVNYRRIVPREVVPPTLAGQIVIRELINILDLLRRGPGSRSKPSCCISVSTHTYTDVYIFEGSRGLVSSMDV